MFYPNINTTVTHNNEIAPAGQHTTQPVPLQGRTITKRSSGNLFKTLLLLGVLISPTRAFMGRSNTEALSKSFTQLNNPEICAIELPFVLKPMCKIDPFLGEMQQSQPIDTYSDTELITHLITAIKSRNSQEILRLNLKDKDIDLNYPLDEKARSFLHLAVEHNFTEGIKVLIEAGADPNHGDRLGLTPLHHAVIRKLPEIIEILETAGADPHKLCFEGFSPLNFVNFLGAKKSKRARFSITEIDDQLEGIRTRKGIHQVYKALINFVTSSVERQAIDTYEPGERLLAAIQSRQYTEILKWNLEDIDLNYPLDESGRSFLHFMLAPECDHQQKIQVVQKLIKQGAMLSYVDRYGLTPVHHATIRNDKRALIEILTFHPNLDQKCMHGFSIWDFAEIMGNAYLVSSERGLFDLLQHSVIEAANPDDQDNNAQPMADLIKYVTSLTAERVKPSPRQAPQYLGIDQCFQSIPLPLPPENVYTTTWPYKHGKNEW